MMKPREFAWSVLNRVINEGGYANLLLRGRKEEFSDADTALVNEIVYGTLRNYDLLEYQWRAYAKNVRRKTAVLLDMSVYQILFLDKIPDYAVVNEAVEMADQRDRKFVNAILRKVIEHGRLAPEFKDDLERTAFETSHPLWLMKLWKAHYGAENAMAIAEHDQTRGVVYGRINTLKTNGDEIRNHPWVEMCENECFRYDGVLTKTDWFRDGKVIIQDRSSQLLPHYLDVKPGMNVLDVCAAPGTKTQEIACLMNNEGSVTANDVSGLRVKLIGSLMERSGVSIVTCTNLDASCENNVWQKESYDRILVDAPCSGLGDLRHKPEIRFHVSPDSLDELVRLQKQILNTAALYLKKDGILVYSTCTLNRKENEAQIASFLAEHEDYELLKENTFLPQQKDSDGFYVAQLHRL